MWSHYADGHTGICIEFEATNQTEFFGEAQPVIYQDEVPALNFLPASQDEKMEAMLLTKAKHWEYEREWRIIHPYSELAPGHGEKRFALHLLSGVVFGCQFPEEHEQEILKWLEG